MITTVVQSAPLRCRQQQVPHLFRILGSEDEDYLMWAHFGLGASDKGKARSDEVVYRLCAKCMVAKGGNTSNLLLHLCIHHPLKFTEVQKLQNRKGNAEEQSSLTSSLKKSGHPTISAAFQIGRKYKRSSKKCAFALQAHHLKGPSAFWDI